MIPTCNIINGDAIEVLQSGIIPECSIQCCVTSPPYYGLRDYGHAGQIGNESSPEEYVAKIVQLGQEIRRILSSTGTFWLNLGDCYYNYRPGYQSQSKQTLTRHTGSVVQSSAKRGLRLDGLKEKDRMMIPARVAIALQQDGWYLRDEIVWHKPNPMPESVTDRCTKSHEFIYLLTKSKDYYYDYRAILEPAAYDGRIDRKNGGDKLPYRQKESEYGVNNQAFNSIHSMDGEPARNKRSVWRVPTINCTDEHFAPFPPALIKPCILAGSKLGDTILDPCAGRGTSGEVAMELGRNAILIEINEKYALMCQRNAMNTTPGLPL